MRARFAWLPLVLLHSAGAQQVLTVVENPNDGSGAADVVADWDGDGLADLLVGAWYESGGYGHARVHSTQDGSPLLSLTGQRSGDGYGRSVLGLADLDGDGRGDFAVGAPTPMPGVAPAYVRVHSGATGQVLFDVTAAEDVERFGHALEGLGDVDGDGLEDFAVSSPLASSAWAGGYVSVVSGASGAVLWSAGSQVPAAPHYGFWDPQGYGFALASMDDIDGDGVRELAAGHATLDRIEILSGASGAVLQVVTQPPGFGAGLPTRFGGSIASGGDFDGDGIEDLLVGAPHEYGVPFFYDGAVYIMRGSDWTMHRRLKDGDNNFGSFVAVSGDQNGDGVLDVVCSQVIDVISIGQHVLSGADGTRLSYQVYAGNPLRGVGDVDGDGFLDYVSAGWRIQNSNPILFIPRTELVLGGRTLPDETSCSYQSFPGWTSPSTCQPDLGTLQDPSAGAGFTIGAYGTPLDRRAFLFWGMGGSPKPFLGGMLCSAGPYKRFPVQGVQNLFGQGGCAGSVSDALDPAYLVQNGLTPGTSFTAQYYIRPAAGSGGAAEVSGGLTVTVWP